MFASPALLPDDSFDKRLAENVHPSNWTNPTPSGKYNLVVVGAGTAGLVAAAGAAGMGAKVALIERSLMGGDCLNVGCVPSKAILAAARGVKAIRQAEHLHVTATQPRIDFEAIMQRMRRLRSEISPHDSAERFRSLGVDVYLGEGRFISPSSVQVGDQTLRFSKAVIATGARAAAPAIDGLDQVQPLTNETLFTLTELPRRMVVLGGGPIGSEMAQAFALFGSEVTLLEASDHILSREDADAASIVQAAMMQDGVRVITNATATKLESCSPNKLVHYTRHGQAAQLETDAVLVAIGRAPNVEGLGLEAAGVEFDTRTGVHVNDFLRTTNPRVFAAGDVAAKFKFTHAADFYARTVIRNALFLGRSRASSLVIPWATYTSPELAQVGFTAVAAEAAGVPVDTFTQEFSKLDRAILEGSIEGFARVHVRKGTDKIVGATIVGENAGDLISIVSLAMAQRIGLKAISGMISPYPTTGECIRKLGDQYNRTRLTPLVAELFRRWLNWHR